jgi:hypothetical protein
VQTHWHFCDLLNSVGKSIKDSPATQLVGTDRVAKEDRLLKFSSVNALTAVKAGTFIAFEMESKRLAGALQLRDAGRVEDSVERGSTSSRVVLLITQASASKRPRDLSGSPARAPITVSTLR